MSEKCEYCESEPLEGECQCPGAQIARLTAERDALAGALKKIAKYDFDVNLQPAAAAMREIAVDTLAAHREK